MNECRELVENDEASLNARKELEQQLKQHKESQEFSKAPGFCSASCVDRAQLQNEIKKPELVKTSDYFTTDCNLPKRFEYPHWFNGYGSQLNKQHPFYRTTSSEYGWYAPGIHSVPTVFYGFTGKFAEKLLQAGMYRIHSVPSVFYPAGQRFTNKLAQAGMYRNYSLNTGMDRSAY